MHSLLRRHGRRPRVRPAAAVIYTGLPGWTRIILDEPYVTNTGRITTDLLADG